MSVRWTQVKKLDTVDAFRTHCAQLGVEIPIDDHVDPAGVLARPVEIRDGSSGSLTAPNRFAVLPMEGWDATTDGRPTDLVRRRWQRFGASGCGLVWGEATAVRADGRANPNQLILDARTVEEIAELRSLLDPAQVVGLQLTHSGRWSRPEGVPLPRTAYAHPLLDRRVDVDARAVFDDGELDELAEAYVAAAVLAQQAGFDFVDVKHCHGYLLHELLTGYDREGRFGGDLHGRTEFLRTVVTGIREQAPGLAIAVRLSAFDMMPFAPGDGEWANRSRTGHTASHSAATPPDSASTSRRLTNCSMSSPISVSGWSAPPPAARTTTRTSNALRTSRRRTGISRPRIRSSVWPGNSP